MITAPGVDAAALERAELLVALHLGLTSLERATEVERVTVSGRLIRLAKPATALRSVTYHGQALNVTRLAPDLYELPVQMSGAVLVTYEVGWTAQTLPAAVRMAALLSVSQASALAGIPEGVTSVRLPEISVTFAGEMRGGITGSAAELLRPYRRSRW